MKKMIEAFERELKAEKYYQTAEKLLPILQEVEKYERCPQDCPDRTYDIPSCKGTCEGYMFRQMKTAMEKKKKASDKVFNGFKKEAVRETKAKIRR